FVAIYNHERSHLALKYKTPDEVHQPFYGQKTVNLYQEQLKPGAYFHERRSLNNFHRDRVITFEQIAE
ncbi:TPA: hypothetical protein ACWP3G_004134, partial [Escherichia coli]